MIQKAQDQPHQYVSMFMMIKLCSRGIPTKTQNLEKKPFKIRRQDVIRYYF